jgi:DNA mismatch endonuclease (patch repair protein)
MVDVMSADKRSALMSRIRAKNTGPELLIRKYLWSAGFRYRLHNKRLPGKPDLVLPRWNATVFVHGCFWHRHAGCPYFRLPKTRAAFWDEKLAGNQARDSAAIAALIDDGWRVAVVWECAVRASSYATGRKLASWLQWKSPSTQLVGQGHAVRSRTLDKPGT